MSNDGFYFGGHISKVVAVARFAYATTFPSCRLKVLLSYLQNDALDQ